ncbi:hypothetical protein GDO81_001122 [Engystomops pustulosus]|uniref:Uncharacterized protein n=1 Tax=Engystomops pustulosus TaxID=76066 RepID=A0AAV7DDD6_ENGPU|nr:hypothetical protein GDO81_001122 [Engystomops pustulosus]
MTKFESPELFSLEGFSSWENKGIQFVHQLHNEGTFKELSVFQEDFNLPHSKFYKYLQLRHAGTTQATKVGSTKETFSVIVLIRGWFNKYTCLSTEGVPEGSWRYHRVLPSIKRWQNKL